MSCLIATGASTAANARDAVVEAWEKVQQKNPNPQVLFLATTVTYNLDEVRQALNDVSGNTKFVGCTSCGGIMTDEGFFGTEGQALALLSLGDDAGDYGIGYAPLGDDARSAAAQAVRAALADAGCEGQLPSAVWMVTSPGNEEAAVRGVADVVGEDVPLVGGSAADNSIAGEWRQIVADGVKENHVVVAVMFTSADVKTSFHSGYDATTYHGKITQADGRTVKEIDGKPASRVYNQWTQGALDDVIEKGGPLLAKTNLYPLGRFLREVKGVPYYVLSHPEYAYEDGSMHLFTDVSVGEELVCMTGTVDNLVLRASNVVRSALVSSGLTPDDATGALIIFCGGCFLTVRDRIDEVHQNLRNALEGVPFLATFTFGEQGRIADVGNRHGNLMIATLMLTQPQ